jgi:hypothetical protein
LKEWTPFLGYITAEIAENNVIIQRHAINRNTQFVFAEAIQVARATIKKNAISSRSKHVGCATKGPLSLSAIFTGCVTHADIIT